MAKVSAVRDQVAELFIRAQSDKAAMKRQLEGLRENRLVSDTGELVLDLDTHTYLVNTPFAACASGVLKGRPIGLGAARFECQTDAGTLFVGSLDGRPLDSSERMLVLYLVDVRATGDETVEQDDGVIRYTCGRLPTLAKVCSADITLRTKHAARMQAYRLQMNGKRIGPLRVGPEQGQCRVHIDTSAGLAFELTTNRTGRAPIVPRNSRASRGQARHARRNP